MTNRICDLFNIKYPIIAGGMVWCSGWKLVSAVSNNGGLGLLSAGSMHPEMLERHIKECQKATDKPFGVNVPLLYPEIDRLMDIIIKSGVKIVFTSAGSPAKWTPLLKENGIKVGHVVSSSKFAKKTEDAGVDVIVAEGFEAGGHNGKEETTTLCLVPQIVDAVKIPVIAAGGIADGRGLAAVLALGAEAAQIGTRFALTKESSAHEDFKKLCISLNEGDTQLTLKQLAPARLIKNKFYDQIREAENRAASIEEIRELLGTGRSKRGIFEGDLENGKLEIGQIASLCKTIPTVKEVFNDIISDFNRIIAEAKKITYLCNENS